MELKVDCDVVLHSRDGKVRSAVLEAGTEVTEGYRHGEKIIEVTGKGRWNGWLLVPDRTLQAKYTV